MSTIKTKNIKQTVVGGTTQPLKIGGILEDGSDAKISISSAGVTTLSGNATTASSLEPIINYTVTSADAQNIDLTGLDFKRGEYYRLFINIPDLTAFTFIYLYINQDYIATHYLSTRTQGGNTDIAASDSTISALTSSGNNNDAIIVLDMMILGTHGFFARGYHNWTNAESRINTMKYSSDWNAVYDAGSKVTSIRLSSSAGNNFVIGTNIKIFRVI